jgi:NAD(P)H-dependent flavin oxidoreductase YrpB (nitropropane dioxygenase family)
MRFIQNGSTEEIPQTYSEVMRVYTEDYRPFHASLPENGKRNVDKALWSFGRFMNGQFRGMVQNRRIS